MTRVFAAATLLLCAGLSTSASAQNKMALSYDCHPIASIPNTTCDPPVPTWQVEKPGILRLVGTQITIRYEDYSFVLYDNERSLGVYGTLEGAKDDAARKLNELLAIGVAP